MIIGIRETKNKGVDDAITKTVNNTWNKHRFRDLKDSGMALSAASISFENLFIIRPDGVDSKNSIVLRKIEDNIML